MVLGSENSRLWPREVVVPPNKDFPEYSMIMGAPAKVVRQLKKSEIDMLKRHYLSYVAYANDYKDN